MLSQQPSGTDEKTSHLAHVPTCDVHIKVTIVQKHMTVKLASKTLTTFTMMARGFRSTPRGGMGQVELLTLTYQSVATAGGCLPVESDFLLSALKKEESKNVTLSLIFLISILR